MSATQSGFPNVASQGEECRSVSHLGGYDVAFRSRVVCRLKGREQEPVGDLLLGTAT
jgi:hypothetical protein